MEADIEKGSGSGMLQGVITGIPGVGKTQFALEYAYRAMKADQYDCVLWIRAETDIDIRQSFAVAGQRLGLQREKSNLDTLIITLDWLEKTG